jgi:predicted permease
MMIYEKTTDFNQSSVSYPDFLDWQRENHSFTDLACFRRNDFNFTGSGQPEHLQGEHVSAGLLPVLGVHPFLGRNFLSQEDREGAGGVVILAYSLWQKRFGGDSHILGRTLTLNAKSYTVIGVLPSDFRFRGQEADLYVPLGQWDSVELRDRENHPGLRVVGRLKPGVTMAAAQAEMTSIARVLAQKFPKTNAREGATVVSMKEDMVGHIRPTLLLLLSAVGFVLLIACANVANLLLARSNARSREFAIRSALGAGRQRVVRQLLTESIMLAFGASLLGLLLASWGARLVLAAVPDALPRSQEIGLDPYVLLFTLLVSVLTGILFGLAPAFHSSKVNPQEALKEGTRGSGGGRHRAEGIFVVLEIGLAMLLLAGAGLMMQSIWRLFRVDAGFDTHHVLTTDVALSPSVVTSPAGIRIAYQQLLDRVSNVPGVQSAAITSLIPLSGDSEIPFWLGKGPQPPQDQMASTLMYITTPGYLRAMGIPLKEGRYISDHDTLASPPVVVVDEVMAEHLFPGQDVLGRQFNLSVIGPVQIVGVVGHVKHWGLDADDTAKIRNEIYFPFLQVPDKFMSEAVAGLTLVLRSGPDPLSLVSAVRAQVAGPTEDQPIFDVETMEQIISDSLTERRFAMLLLIIFASTALVLAAVGIYGVMSYAVSRRTHELGVRIALGASRHEILRLVVREGITLAVAGTGVGLAAAFALTRFMASLLYGVRPADPATLGAMSLLLVGIALLACCIPAWRATRVDPLVALRYE